MEIFNEAMLMCLYYHLLCFTNFVIDSETSYLMSNSFLLILGGTIVINFAMMFKDNLTLAIIYLYKKYSVWNEKRELKNKKSLAELTANSGI